MRDDIDGQSREAEIGAEHDQLGCFNFRGSLLDQSLASDYPMRQIVQDSQHERTKNNQ